MAFVEAQCVSEGEQLREWGLLPKWHCVHGNTTSLLIGWIGGVTGVGHVVGQVAGWLVHETVL